MCGASFSRGLWGLVAMLANSASQLVLGEQLSSWWDTAPTWNNLGDLWSSSTSCSSGMSSKEIIQYFSYAYLKGSVCLTADCTFFLASFTILHVAPRRGRQVLITLERIERLVHFQDVRFPLFQNKKTGYCPAYLASIVILWHIIWFWAKPKDKVRAIISKMELLLTSESGLCNNQLHLKPLRQLLL